MASFADFAYQRQEIATIANDLAVWLDDTPGGAEAAAHLRQTAVRFQNGRFHVLVLGGFSVGKSTLVNALLGADVLPSKVNPCTAILTELTYGEIPKATVNRRDGTTETLDVPDFLRRFQLETTESDSLSSIERAVVEWPLPLLRDGVTLIDSPGLDDDPVRTKRTLSAIPEADAVILVLNATRFLTQLERHILDSELRPRKLDNLFFPIAMADHLARLSTDPERDRTRVNEQASLELNSFTSNQSRFFLVNAQATLLHRKNGAPDADTGFLAFEESLRDFLIHDRGAAQTSRFRATLSALCDELHLQSVREQAVFGLSLQELQKRQTSLEPHFVALAHQVDAIDAQALQFIERQQLGVVDSLRAFAAQVEAEIPLQLASFMLGKRALVELWTAQGRQKMEMRLNEQLQRWLEQQAAAWNQRLQVQMAEEIEALRARLAPQARSFEASIAEIRSIFSGVVLPGLSASTVDPTERWFSVAIGALLLSPGTIAAGWVGGYEGALQGASGRLAARLTAVVLGLAVGPLGWIGLALYLVSDLLVLAWSGDRQLQDLKRQWADATRGKIVNHVDENAAEIRSEIAAALAPFRKGLMDAALADVHRVREEIDRTVEQISQTTQNAEEHRALWDRRLAAFSAALQEVS